MHANYAKVDQNRLDATDMNTCYLVHEIDRLVDFSVSTDKPAATHPLPQLPVLQLCMSSNYTTMLEMNKNRGVRHSQKSRTEIFSEISKSSEIWNPNFEPGLRISDYRWISKVLESSYNLQIWILDTERISAIPIVLGIYRRDLRYGTLFAQKCFKFSPRIRVFRYIRGWHNSHNTTSAHTPAA